MAIETIYKAGDDALQNQFQVELAPLPFIPDGVNLAIRVTSLDVPEQSVGTYEVHYRSQKMTKASGKIETPNEFSFTFRVDKYWVHYKALKKWLNYIGNNKTGTMAEDVGLIGGESGFRMPFITINTVDANDQITSTGWTFHNVFISQLDGVSFSQDSGEPIEVSATFQFMKMTSLED